MRQQFQLNLTLKYVAVMGMAIGCAIFVSCGDEGEGVTPTENEQTPSLSDDQITPPLDGQIPADGIVENQDGKDVVERLDVGRIHAECSGRSLPRNCKGRRLLGMSFGGDKYGLCIYATRIRI